MLTPKVKNLQAPSPEGTDAVSTQGLPGGPAAINEGVTPVEASGVPRSDLGEGPKVGDAGEYKPARYKLTSGAICEDR